MMILIIITMSFVANELDCAVSHLLSPLSIKSTPSKYDYYFTTEVFIVSRRRQIHIFRVNG